MNTTTNALTAPAGGAAAGIVTVFLIRALFPGVDPSLFTPELGVAIGTLWALVFGWSVKPTRGP
jgi:hypothetical protein